MKVAISAQGNTPQDRVDPRFGRARQFIIMDTENDGYESVDNTQNLNAAQGAGIQAAQNVVNKGAKVVITGHCGPKAFRTLSAANIGVYSGADRTVEDAFGLYKRGELEKINDADVEGHWKH